MRLATNPDPRPPLAFFFLVVLVAEKRAHADLHGALFAERRLLVANLVAARPQEQPRTGGLAVEPLAAHVAVEVFRRARLRAPRLQRLLGLGAIGGQERRRTHGRSIVLGFGQASEPI